MKTTQTAQDSSYKKITILKKLFEGCETNRGVLGRIINGHKKAWVEPEPFDWNLHVTGKKVQGLSPVNSETGMVKWLGLDVDLTIKAITFCGNIWTFIGTQYWCYLTMGGKWRVVEHLDDWIGVDEAKERAKQLEKRVEKLLGYKCDSGHTLPQGYNIEDAKPGNWWFMPYHNEETVCYGPGGDKLNVEQLEFRYRYKDHPLVIACIGMKGGGEKNKRASRRKALWVIQLYKRHFPNCKIDLKEVDKHFDKSLTEEFGDRELEEDIRHVEKSALKAEYTKEYLLKGLPGWITKFCGAKPLIDAKGLCEVSDELCINYIYVRDRTDFFELITKLFVTKDQLNDWWKHFTKKENMSALLLKDEDFKKIQSYLTHAGLPSGIIKIERGRVKGLDAGEYLNIYQESGVIAKRGDISKLDEYYNWLLGKDNWHIQKQRLAFMLKEPGEKIMWFTIWHSQTQGVGKGLFALITQSLFGPRNVKPNVAFKHLTSGHSTIIEGAQIIFLNEVSLTNSKGDLKELSNEFKSFITDPVLIINPKNKPQIEIPNLCNFEVHSNSETPLYLGESDRRAFVVNITKSRAEVKQKLVTEGYKKEILKVIDDPSAFKWHLENEIEYDREMFFEDAPMTKDKEELIQANRSDFEKIMDQCFEEQSFPFGPMLLIDKSFYHYKGILHALSLYKVLKASALFKGTFFKSYDVEKYLASKCIPWNDRGDKTRQIGSANSGGKKRIYLMHNWRVEQENHIIELTEGELLDLFENPNIEVEKFEKPLKEDPPTIIKDKDTHDKIKEAFPDAKVERMREPGEEDIEKELPNFEDVKEKGKYQNFCWSCYDGINSDTNKLCSACEVCFICNECGKCYCDKPGSKVKKKNYF